MRVCACQALEHVVIWRVTGGTQYLDLLHEPVLFFVIRLGELVDFDFVLLDLPHDLTGGEKMLTAEWNKVPDIKLTVVNVF